MSELEKYFNSSESKIDIDKYLLICEQLGVEPDPAKMPPDFAQFPEIVHYAVMIYNALGDRVQPDIGFLGKDYSNLEFLIDLYGIDDKEFLVEIILFMDARARKKSSDQMKKAHDKLKRKQNGGKKRN